MIFNRKIFLGSLILSVFLFCEFFIYYLVLYQCNWPGKINGNGKLLKAMIFADPHLLGPRRGHWFDKLRREWQMHRTFQTTMTLFQPEVVFILGDLFDEGEWVNNAEFKAYIDRFHKLFYTPQESSVISVVGNHDIGFHYKLHPYMVDRFEKAINNTGINLHTIKDINFVTINSMAMQNDGCYFCENALNDLNRIHNTLTCAHNKTKCHQSSHSNLAYSKPIILQHFPSYRASDETCLEHDAPAIETYRETWEVLSKEATNIIGDLLQPRVMFSGHSHHYCRLINSLKVEEFTVASFSWRNKKSPSFLLATFTPEEYSVSLCYMPKETTVQIIYVGGIIFCVVFVLHCIYLSIRDRKTAKSKTF